MNSNVVATYINLTKSHQTYVTMTTRFQVSHWRHNVVRFIKTEFLQARFLGVELENVNRY